MVIPFMEISYLYHTVKLIPYHMNSTFQHENMQLETLILEAKKTYHTYSLFCMSLIIARNISFLIDLL